MQVVSLALRTWIRYAVPLTLLAAIAFVPVIVFGWTRDVPADAAAARSTALVGYGLGVIAWVFQLALVGAVAPAVRGMADNGPGSQWQILTRGLRSGFAGLAPAAVVTMAVLVASVALVVPGVIVLGLLAPAAASREVGAPMPAPLVDTLAVTRRSVGAAIGLAVAILAIDVGIAVAVHALLAVPVATKMPSAASLERARSCVLATIGALVAISPLVAVHVAALYDVKRRS